MNSLRSTDSAAESVYLRKDHSFSLVEVVVAMGISIFALVTIVALLPAGLKSTSESVDESRAVNILSAVVADRNATSFAVQSKIYQLPALTNTLTQVVTNSFGIGDDDSFTGSNLKQARYRVDYMLTPPSSGRADPYLGWFRISWPAQSTNYVGAVETTVAFPQP